MAAITQRMVSTSFCASGRTVPVFGNNILDAEKEIPDEIIVGDSAEQN